MGYIEPAPIRDHENPFESMMSRFDLASQTLGLDKEIYNVLKSPVKQVIVSLPITMDDMDNGVFHHPLDAGTKSGCVFTNVVSSPLMA